MASHHDHQMTLIFRCLPELEAVLPRPIPAIQGLPDWFKAMPLTAFNPTLNNKDQTVKRCPPFIDAMTYGFLMPLMCDLKVENGEFSWEQDIPMSASAGTSAAPARSPIGFHDASQVVGTPLFEQDRFLIKFHNFWAIEAPPGYSLLFTHPVNRPDLPFTTLTGLVDCDRYRDNWVHFPARWHDANFTGVLPKGTPVAQCLPVKRESWTSRFEPMSNQDVQRVRDVRDTLAEHTGLYRREFRTPKR